MDSPEQHVREDPEDYSQSHVHPGGRAPCRQVRLHRKRDVRRLSDGCCCLFYWLGSNFDFQAFCQTGKYNGRYLLPAVALIVVPVFAQKFDFQTSPFFNLFRALILVGFLSNVLVVNTSYWATYHASEAHHDDYQNYDKPYELMEFLRENGLVYGYSTYWNASVITVLSDHRTVVVQVYLKDGVPNRFNWLSTDRWYRPSNYVGDSFLLLSEDEAKSVDWAELSSRFGLAPYKTLVYKNFRVYVFSENIANKLKF